MTDNEKYIAILRWLVTSPFARSPSNTDGDIDYHLKELYPELKTPTGAWGLHPLLDQLIKDEYVRYQDREGQGLLGNTIRWYEATQEGIDYINEMIGQEKLLNNAQKDNSIPPIDMLDKVLEWFAMNPKEYQGNSNISRENVTESQLGSDIVQFYFPELNTIEFLNELGLILNKLVKDEYIEEVVSIYPKKYSVTFEGKYFSKSGGYKAKLESEATNQQSQKHRDQLLASYQKWVVIGTLVAASYYLKELLVWVCHFLATKK